MKEVYFSFSFYMWRDWATECKGTCLSLYSKKQELVFELESSGPNTCDFNIYTALHLIYSSRIFTIKHMHRHSSGKNMLTDWKWLSLEREKCGLMVGRNFKFYSVCFYRVLICYSKHVFRSDNMNIGLKKKINWQYHTHHN